MTMKLEIVKLNKIKKQSKKWYIPFNNFSLRLIKMLITAENINDISHLFNNNVVYSKNSVSYNQQLFALERFHFYLIKINVYAINNTYKLIKFSLNIPT